MRRAKATPRACRPVRPSRQWRMDALFGSIRARAASKAGVSTSRRVRPDHGPENGTDSIDSWSRSMKTLQLKNVGQISHANLVFGDLTVLVGLHRRPPDGAQAERRGWRCASARPGLESAASENVSADGLRSACRAPGARRHQWHSIAPGRPESSAPCATAKARRPFDDGSASSGSV